MKKIWFDCKPKTTIATKYIQSAANIDLALMTQCPFTTLTANLEQTQEQLLSKCTPNCRNEIRKGEKLGLGFHVGPVTLSDVSFIQTFLRAKNLGRFNSAYLYEPKALVCTVSFGQMRIATHLYIISSRTSRSRLVYSAVAEQALVTTPLGMSPQRFIGIANRSLHFFSMLNFKAQGLSVYDFGGIAPEETSLKIKGINEFKASFGGEQRVEYNYTPTWIAVVELVFQKLKLLYRRLNQSKQKEEA